MVESIDIKTATRELVEESVEDSEKKQPRPFEILTVADYRAYKHKKKFLISKIIGDNEVIMFYGKSGSMKSLLVLNMCLAVATGKLFLDNFKTSQSPVLLISAENTIQTDKERIINVLKGIKSRKRKLPFYVIPRTSTGDLLEKDFYQKVCQVIEDKKIKFLVCDTINPLATIDDNSVKDVCRLFNDVLKPLADDYHLTCMFVHHTGKSNTATFLGSVKFKAESDSVFELVRKDKSNTVTLRHEKGREGENEDMKIKLTFEPKKILFSFEGYSDSEDYESINSKKIESAKFYILEHFGESFKSAEIMPVIKEEFGLSERSIYSLLNSFIKIKRGEYNNVLQ